MANPVDAVRLSNTVIPTNIAALANNTQTDNMEISALPIQIRSLYKIFGASPESYLDLVKDGIDKETLKQQHSHVLGLKDINIDIPAGQISVVMGLSGSGKSTLIRNINRLIDPTSGTITIGENAITDMSLNQLHKFRREQTAMVFQKFALFPHMTVGENIEYSLMVRKVKLTQRHKTSRYWLERVGLEGYCDYFPNQLSGGMQQRVGLARALANNSPVLLMDEAFSALDPLIRDDMQTMLLELQQDMSKTIVFISHDLDESLRLGDHIAILRDGEIIQQGTGQDILLNPVNDYIADFVRMVNRGRVIQCKNLMKPSTIQHPVRVQPITLIEEVVRLLNDHDSEYASVVNQHDRLLGEVSLGDMLEVMVQETRLNPNANEEIKKAQEQTKTAA